MLLRRYGDNRPDCFILCQEEPKFPGFPKSDSIAKTNAEKDGIEINVAGIKKKVKSAKPPMNREG